MLNNLLMDPVTLFEVSGTVGVGSAVDPVRRITTYFEGNGEPVLEYDPHLGVLIFKGKEFNRAPTEAKGDGG